MLLYVLGSPCRYLIWLELLCVLWGLCRCTCDASEDGLDSAMANCVIAEDEVFCRCVLENAGDASMVS